MVRLSVPCVEMLGACHDTVIGNNTFISTGPIEATNSNDFVITGNRFKCGTAKAINMIGTCDRWVIVGNNAQGSATSTFVGANNVKASNVNL